MRLFSRRTCASRPRNALEFALRFRPALEKLESRLAPWVASGNAWVHPELVTISFMPDGTDLGGVTSNLVSNFNARFGAPATWQNQILKAAQVWGKNTNLNFAVVSDNGAPAGSGSYQQGDAGFGDIRIGGYNFGTSTLASAFSPPQINNYSIAGDISLNTAQAFNIGATYDVFTVAVHEFGHALGLMHSGTITADLYATYNGVDTGLQMDDIYGIRSVYSAGEPRAADYNDANGGNDSFAAATDITQHIQADLTVLRENRDIRTTSDLDFFKLTAPVGTGSLVQIAIQSSGLSLLAPKVTVYAADQVTILGLADGLGQYGTTLTVNLENQISAGQVIYVKVQGADTSAFGTGKYAISGSFGGAPLRWQAPPITQTANGTPLSGGGGIVQAQSQEYLVNSYTDYNQETSAENRQAVAMDANGNYVIVWASQYQDGDGWGVFAQLYDVAGVPIGYEFQVNTWTEKDQMFPTVAMAPYGDFVVTWSSVNQDGDSWGVYAQLYDAAGQAQGPEFLVNSTTSKEQLYSSVAIGANGDFIITWSGINWSSDWDIYARRYSADGNVHGNEFRVNANTSKEQVYSALALDPIGGFVITWSSKDQDGSGWGIYARRYAVVGSTAFPGNEFRVNSTRAGDQLFPSVGMNAKGDFIVTWTSMRQDGYGNDIRARRFNALGSALSPEFQVNVTTKNDQLHSAIAMNAEGNFVIVWSSYDQDGDAWGVFGRQYADDGTARDEVEFSVNATLTSGSQRNPSIARNDKGNIIVVWTGTGADGSADVFADPLLVGSDDLLPGIGPEGCGCPICQGAQRRWGHAPATLFETVSSAAAPLTLADWLESLSVENQEEPLADTALLGTNRRVKSAKLANDCTLTTLDAGTEELLLGLGGDER